MIALLTAWQLATSRVGLPILVAGALVLFYEGLPLGPVRWVPWLGPKLELLTDGRVDIARKEGALAERLAWQERQRAADEAQRQRDAEKQRQLDAIAAQYDVAVEDQLDKSNKIAALEAALTAAQEDKGDAKEPAAGAPRYGGVAIRRGVSDALDAIGRR